MSTPLPPQQLHCGGTSQTLQKCLENKRHHQSLPLSGTFGSARVRVPGSRNSPFCTPVPLHSPVPSFHRPTRTTPALRPPNPQLLRLRPGLGTSGSRRAASFPSSREGVGRGTRRAGSGSWGGPPYLQPAEQRAERKQRGQRAAPPGARGHGAEGRAGRPALRPLLPRRRGSSWPRGRSSPPPPGPAPPRPAAARRRPAPPRPAPGTCSRPPARQVVPERGGRCPLPAPCWGVGGRKGCREVRVAGGDLGCSPRPPPASSAALCTPVRRFACDLPSGVFHGHRRGRPASQDCWGRTPGEGRQPGGLAPASRPRSGFPAGPPKVGAPRPRVNEERVSIGDSIELSERINPI